MSITIDEKKRVFTLHTAGTSYQMQADSLGYLLHLYYGPALPPDQDMEHLLVYLDRGYSGNPEEMADGRSYSLDALPQEYPFKGTGDYRSPAFVMENPDGTLTCDLRYKDHRIFEGKYTLASLPSARGAGRLSPAGETAPVNAAGGKNQSNCMTLEITLEDRFSGIEIRLLYGVYEKEDIITRCAVIRNAGKGEIILRRAATACLDFLTGSFDLVHFHGRHTMECQPERTEVGYHMTAIGSRRGTSSHQHNPGVILAGKDTAEEKGGAYGVLLSYSGGFLCEAEKDQFGQTRLVMGMTDDQLAFRLSPGTRLELPECILAYTDGGFRKLSHLFHDFLRAYVIRDPGRCPVLINSWETAYFDFNGETIRRLAEQAAELGIGLLVMDDGWFGDRGPDTRGLGDWKVNEKKLGCTLSELSAYITGLGLKFGLWIEPEMINEDSALYREHPDWVMRVPGRSPVYSRNQLVLDFTRQDVRERIFTDICSCLDQAGISYLKWDMNRSIADLWSAEHLPGEILYRYTAGVYSFLQMLTDRYPSLVIEGCSGGGGRFDAGMLSYCPQIWCSDNTDAADRLLIQYGTSFFYPPCCMGAHVSAVPNHQTGRSVPFETRGITAMAGAFGYELDPAVLSAEEREQIRKQISDYGKYRHLMNEGDYYRLTDPSADGIAAWEFAAKDGSEALVSIVKTEMHGNMEVKYVRPAGLDPRARYTNSADKKEYTGAALMYGGIPVMPALGAYEAVQLRLCRN